MYTVPASTKAYIRHVRIVNTDSVAVTVNVSVGTDGTSTRWLSGYQIAANDVYEWSGLLVLATGTVLQAFAARASICNFFADGFEET